jgi:hypothetical protein
LVPGQIQTITCPMRDLSIDAVITDIVAKDYGKGGQRLLYSVTATSGEVQQENWRDTYKLWAGDKLGKGTSLTASSPTIGEGGVARIGGAAPPNRAIQFNNAGAFGGDAAFLWYADENSLVCGGNGSSITATSFESCQVFGSNCHIADPS